MKKSFEANIQEFEYSDESDDVVDDNSQQLRIHEGPKKHRIRNKGRKAVFLLDNLITDQRQFMLQQFPYFYQPNQQNQYIQHPNIVVQDQTACGQNPVKFHVQPCIYTFLESIHANYVPGPIDFLPRGKI